MDIDEVLDELGRTNHTFPRDALQWALDHWDEARPRFMELLDGYQGGANRTPQNANAVSFIVHLLGEKRETSAFRSLCLLFADPVMESIPGDAITVTARNILISTYDGDPAPLKRLISCDNAVAYARESALQAMSYLARHGACTKEEMRSFLNQLHAEFSVRDDPSMWMTWVIAIANLGYSDYVPQVEDLFRRGVFDDEFILDWDDFEAQLHVTLQDPRRLAGFERDGIGPFTDTIDELFRWCCYSKSDPRESPDQIEFDPELFGSSDRPLWLKSDKFERTDPLLEDDGPELWLDELKKIQTQEEIEPVWNPLRKVGRNDPCPCGSGKKFERCCLS